MVVGIKDISKMVGIIIISACAVLVCTLFLNYNLDLGSMEDLMTTEMLRVYYDALVMTGTVVCTVSGGCLLMTSVVMLFFYIKHYIDTHRQELGILKALGYSNWKIARRFWVFGLSIFAGTALGYLGALGIMPKFYAVQNEDHLIPEVVLHFQPLLVVCLILLPTAFFALLSVGYGYGKLKTPVLELIKGKAGQKASKTRRNSDLPFLQELRKNTLRQRKTLVFFIAFATFCYAAMMQMSSSMEELSSPMMGMMIMLIGIVLACVTLFLAVTTVINGNTKTIAMMRVFGYSLRECSKAILGCYRPVAYIGFVLGTIYQYALLKIMVYVVFKDVAEVPEYTFDVPVCAITLVSFVILYEFIMYAYSRRIAGISVKEIMLES